MDKKFLIILAVVLVALFGLFFLTGNKKDSGNNSGTESSTVSNHSKGGNSKNVELLVYGDFQCPVCSEFAVIENAIYEKYKDQIKFTYRHYPLDTIHPNARAAHRAAQAAGIQGKFFEMHDLLYQNQNIWSDSANPKTTFESYAEQLGLDINKFKADYETQAVNATINADKNEGTGKGVQGTPTYFINGNKLDNKNLSSVDDFSKVIEQYINQ